MTTSASKIHTAVLAFALAATALLSASNATAQGHEMTAKIPFAFHSGQQRLPAGVYRVEIQSEHVILLRGTQESGYVMTNPEISTVSSHSKLVFRRYGDQYFLREVWTAGSNTGLACTKSKQEKEAEIASMKAAPSGREVALAQSGR